MYLFFAIIFWSITFVNTRSLLLDFSALEIMFIRFALAWAALCGWAFLKERESVKWMGRCELLFAAMGLSGVVAYQFLENCAIYYTNASNVAILVSIGPIVTALFARLFLNDRTLSVKNVIGSLVAMLGAAVVSLNGVFELAMHPLGDLMALGGMFCWGVYSVLIVKANDCGLSVMAITRKSFGWAIVMMLLVMVWGATESGFYALDGSFSVCTDIGLNVERFSRPLNCVNLCFLGLCASALAFVFWSKACAALGVVKTTICLYLEPIIAVVFAVLFLGENVSLMSIIGGVVIAVGVYIANRSGRK
jgi:drug/metabolite transporter (DMT)-like permease